MTKQRGCKIETSGTEVSILLLVLSHFPTTHLFVVFVGLSVLRGPNPKKTQSNKHATNKGVDIYQFS